jgi:hypothetical protein
MRASQSGAVGGGGRRQHAAEAAANGYELGEAVGRGASGVVYHARERGPGGAAAVKCVSRERLGAGGVDRLLGEIRSRPPRGG